VISDVLDVLTSKLCFHRSIQPEEHLSITRIEREGTLSASERVFVLGASCWSVKIEEGNFSINRHTRERACFKQINCYQQHVRTLTGPAPTTIRSYIQSISEVSDQGVEASE
jgi:hypothetical protein